jgi:hypothetical protein
MQAAPNPVVKDGTPILRITSTARMIAVSSPMTSAPTFSIEIEGSEFGLQDTLNTVIGQDRGTLSLAYFGLPTDDTLDDAGWTPFNPQIVDSLEYIDDVRIRRIGSPTRKADVRDRERSASIASNTCSVSEDRLGPEVHAPSRWKVPGQTLIERPDRALTYGLPANRSTFTPRGNVGASASR